MSEEISREEIAAMLARESMSEKMTKEDIDKMLSPIKAVVDAADDLLKLVRESEEMTREQAIAYFKSRLAVTVDDYKEPIKMAITALSAEPMRWIPVTERLPQKSEYGDVLVTFIPSGGTLWTKVMIAHYSDLMGIAKPCFHVGDVGKVDFQDITNQVTAWMPLPKPWSGKESE